MADIPSYLQRPDEAVPQQTAAVSFDDNTEPTVEVYDHTNKAVVHAPESDVEHLLSTGQYTLRNGDVSVVAPDGGSGTMPAENIHKALAEGFRLETKAEKAKRELDDKYGDQELLALEAGVARTGSFGLSDKLLTNLPASLGGMTAEQLRGIQEANPIASGIGEFGGYFSPAGIGGALTKAGGLAERAAFKTLSKAGVQNKVAKSIVEKILPKAAGGAVEGTIMGVGQLISEDALGKADFNAENLMASTGYGALGGGAVGSLFGAASAAAPLVTKAAKLVTDPLAKIAEKSMNKSKAALELMGVSPTKIADMAMERPKLYNEFPEWVKTRLNLQKTDTAEDLYNKAAKLKTEAGAELQQVYKDVDDLHVVGGLRKVNESELAAKIEEKLQPDIRRLASEGASRGEATKLENLVNSYKENGNISLSVNDIWKKRQTIDELAKAAYDKTKSEQTPYQKALLSIRSVYDDAIQTATSSAEAIAKDAQATGKLNIPNINLTERMEQANKDYFYTSKFNKGLGRKVVKDAESLKFGDTMLALLFGSGDFGKVIAVAKKTLDSDFRKKLIVLSDLEKANLKVADTVNKSVKSFFDNTSKIVKPVSTAALLKYDLAADLQNETKKPKKADSRAKAYNNVVQNLQKYSEQPEAFIDRSNRKTASMYEHAPETSAALDATALKGIQFLQSKVPKRATQEGVFNMLSKPLQPSTIDMAKFERYFEAVENPLSVVKDLENGTISNEGIETLKTVYPNIYSKVRDSAINYLTEKKPSVSYNKKIQLGLMLDIPSDTSLLPQNVMGLQSNFAPVGNEQQNGVEGMVNPTAGGMDKLSFDDRAKTGAETETL